MHNKDLKLVQSFKEQISPYLPEGAFKLVSKISDPYDFTFHLAKSRTTKLGDYRGPYNGEPHRITVNQDLNQYAFLVTYLHELAHLIVYEDYTRKPKPHGREWKHEFRGLAEHFYGKNILPDDLEEILVTSLKSPKANTCADPALMRALSHYDNGIKPLWLEELPEQSAFALKNGQVFTKGKKQRTRFRCKEKRSRRIYLIHGMAEVKLIA